MNWQLLLEHLLFAGALVGAVVRAVGVCGDYGRTMRRIERARYDDAFAKSLGCSPRIEPTMAIFQGDKTKWTAIPFGEARNRIKPPRRNP
jgi:hypothetical protein